MEQYRSEAYYDMEQNDSFYQDGINKWKLNKKGEARQTHRLLKIAIPIVLLLIIIGMVTGIALWIREAGKKTEERGRLDQAAVQTESEQEENEHKETTGYKEAALDFDADSNLKLELKGYSIDVPKAWELEGNIFVAESDPGTAEFYYLICDKSEYTYISTEEKMVEKSEDLFEEALNTMEDMRETEAEKISIREYNGHKFVCRNYRGVMQDDVEVTLEIAIFFNDRIGRAVIVELVQSENCRYDHFEDFHKMLESVAPSDLMMSVLPDDAVTMGGMYFPLPDFFDVLSEDSSDIYQHYYPSAEGAATSLIFAQIEGAEDFSAMSEDDLVTRFVGEDTRYIISSIQDLELPVGNAKTVGLVMQGKDEDFSNCVITGLSNKELECTVYVVLLIDRQDTSDHDYISDYGNMLNTMSFLDNGIK